MNHHNQFNEDPDYLEEIPPLSVRLTAQRVILNAIAKAKITCDGYRMKKIICRFKTTGSFSKCLNKTAA